MSKYYTPEIEEFHVGFECEINAGAREDKKFFVDAIINSDTLSYVGDWLSKNDIRVKYLDQEDIESFGFKVIHEWYTENTNIIPFSIKLPPKEYRGGGFRILFFNKDSYEIQIFNDRVDKVSMLYYSGLFQGKVKNKSELRRILKQIGVYDK